VSGVVTEEQGEQKTGFGRERFRKVGTVQVDSSIHLHHDDDSGPRTGSATAEIIEVFEVRLPGDAECPATDDEESSASAVDLLLELGQPPHKRASAVGSGASACRYNITYEDLTFLDRDQPVGQGSYGWVYKARWRGVEVAVKQLARQRFDEESRLRFREESVLLAQLRHPHVVLFIGVCLRAPNVCIVTEWMQRGSLRDVLDDQSLDLAWPLRLSIVRGIALGLVHLHSYTPAILHRDLNSSNVLIDESWNAKIAGSNRFLSFSLRCLSRHAEEALTSSFFWGRDWCGARLWAGEDEAGERHDDLVRHTSVDGARDRAAREVHGASRYLLAGRRAVGGGHARTTLCQRWQGTGCAQHRRGQAASNPDQRASVLRRPGAGVLEGEGGQASECPTGVRQD
jgi:tRNA A-37 threonylcarbamoyl transferase component Bud32